MTKLSLNVGSQVSAVEVAAENKVEKMEETTMTKLGLNVGKAVAAGVVATTVAPAVVAPVVVEETVISRLAKLVDAGSARSGFEMGMKMTVTQLKEIVLFLNNETEVKIAASVVDGGLRRPLRKAEMIRAIRSELGFGELLIKKESVKKLTISDSAELTKLLNSTIDYTTHKVQGFVVKKSSAFYKLGTAAKSFEEFAPVSPVLDIMVNKKVYSAMNAIAGIYSFQFDTKGKNVGVSMTEDGAYIVKNKKGIVTDVLYGVVTNLSGEVSAYASIFTGKVVDKLPKGAVQIFTIGSSASASRGDMYYFVEIEFLAPFVAYANKTFNKALDIAELKGDMKKLNATMVRLHHRSTPQVNLGSPETYIMYTGAFANGSTDGTSLVSIYFMKRLSEKYLTAYMGTQTVVTMNAVSSLALQSRAATLKDQSAIETETFMREVVKAEIEKGANLVIVNPNTVTQEESARLQALPNTFLVVTTNENFNIETDHFDMLFDDNAKKMNFDLSTTVEFNMLKVVKKIEKIYTTQQVLSKFIHLPGGMDVVREIAYSDTNRMLESVDKGSFDWDDIASEEDILSGDITGVAKKIMPANALKMFPFIKKDIYVSAWDQMFKKISKMRFEIEGDYLTAMIDPSTFFLGGEHGVIRGNEIFVPGSKALISLLIKFPSVHFREFLLAHVVDIETIAERLNECVALGQLDMKQARAIIKSFKMKDDRTVITSGKAILKDMLAGFDTDTDAFERITDERIINIMTKHQVKPLAVIINKPKASGNKKEYDIKVESFNEAVAAALKVKGLSIGQATFLGETIATLNMAKDHVRPLVLEKLFGGQGLNEYKGLPRGEKDGFETIEVSEDLAVQLLADLKTTKFDVSMVNQLIEDLVAVVRYLQEVTIDAAKTSVYSAVDLALEYGEGADKKRFDMDMHLKLHTPSFDREEGVLTYELEDGSKRSNVFYMKTKLRELQMELLDHVQSNLQAKIDALPKELEEVLAKLIRTTPAEFEGAMVRWNSSYIQIESEYIAMTSPVVDGETGEVTVLSDEDLMPYRQMRAERLQALVNTIRLETADLSPIDLGKMALNISLLDRQGNFRKSSSRFYRILPMEFFAAVSAMTKGMTDEKGEVIKHAGFFGKKIQVLSKFNNGIIKNGTRIEFDGDTGECISHVGSDAAGNEQMIVKSDLSLSGKYIVKEHKGEFIAVKSLDEALARVHADKIQEVKIKGEFRLSVYNGEKLDVALEKLEEQSKVLIKYNGANAFICSEGGTPIAGLNILGSKEIKDQLNGNLFDLVEIKHVEGDFEKLEVMIANGFVVDTKVAFTSGKLVNADKEKFTNNKKFGKKQEPVQSIAGEGTETIEALFDDMF